MSKIFSKVEAYNGVSLVEFIASGWVLDEDDFFECDEMDDFIDDACNDIEVDVKIYSFGEGESERANNADMEMLTDEFIDNECDCIEIRNFVIIKED